MRHPELSAQAYRTLNEVAVAVNAAGAGGVHRGREWQLGRTERRAVLVGLRTWPPMKKPLRPDG